MVFDYDGAGNGKVNEIVIFIFLSIQLLFPHLYADHDAAISTTNTAVLKYHHILCSLSKM